MSKIHYLKRRNGKNGHAPRAVDFLNNRDDYKCALLGALGFSTVCIERETDLTDNRINYRLKKAEISRREFRDGTSVFAKMFMRHAKEIAAPKLEHYLRQHAPASHANVRRAAA